MSHVVKEKIGLPVWDGEFVRDIAMKMPGDTITDEELAAAQQDEDECAMLIQHNCYTDEELQAHHEEMDRQEMASASVHDANESLPTQEER